MRDKLVKPAETDGASGTRLPLLTALAVMASPAVADARQSPSAESQMKDAGDPDARARKRIHVFLPAAIESDDGEHQVKLRNLSQGGAQIETEALLESGESLLFKRGLFTLFATVIWTAGNRAGLRFDTEIDEGNLFVLTRRLPASAPRSWIGGYA